MSKRLLIASVIVLVHVYLLLVRPVYAGELTRPSTYSVNNWFDHDPSGVMKRFDEATSYPYNGHNGIDYDTPNDIQSNNYPAYAAAKGEVKATAYDDCGGNYVRIWHSSPGISTYYGHLKSNFQVSVSDFVRRGKVVGYSGGTGSCISGVVIHLEVLDYNGSIGDGSHSIDPFGWTGVGTDPCVACRGYESGLWTGGNSSSNPLFYNREYRVYFTGSDGNVWGLGYDGKLFWDDWGDVSPGTVPSGGFEYQPAAEVLSANDKIYLFAKGVTDDKFYYNVGELGVGYDGWTKIDNPPLNMTASPSFIGAPKVVEWDNYIWVFGQATNHQIYKAKVDSSGDWSGWSSLGNLASNVDAASDPMVRVYSGPGTDYMIVAVTSNHNGGSTNDAKVYTIKNSAAGGWDGSWNSRGGPGPNSKVNNWTDGSGRVWTDMLGAAYLNSFDTDDQYYFVFAQADDQKVYRNWFYNGSWGSSTDWAVILSTSTAYAPNAEGIGSDADELWVLSRELSNDQIIIRGRGADWYSVCTALNSTLYRNGNAGTVPWAESIGSDYGDANDEIWVAFRDADKELAFISHVHGTDGECDNNGWTWKDDRPSSNPSSPSGVTLESDPWAFDW